MEKTQENEDNVELDQEYVKRVWEKMLELHQKFGDMVAALEDTLEDTLPEFRSKVEKTRRMMKICEKVNVTVLKNKKEFADKLGDEVDRTDLDNQILQYSRHCGAAYPHYQRLQRLNYMAETSNRVRAGEFMKRRLQMSPLEMYLNFEELDFIESVSVYCLVLFYLTYLISIILLFSLAFFL